MHYTWGGSVVGRDGKAVPVAGNFTTITPAVEVNGQFQLADGQVVGVAAPIILQFDASISDKAAVERALKVTTDPPVEGSWAWLPDEAQGSRVHWRTREYYPAGTKVNVDARLYGVSFGDGAYGAADSTLDFEIGRRQVVKAEASVAPHPGDHRRRRHHGLPVQLRRGRPAAQRHPQRHPRGEREVRRLLHVQPGGRLQPTCASGSRCGSPTTASSSTPTRPARARRATPTSPTAASTCRLGDAQQYFNSAIYGDPVEVTGTSIQLSYADGDIWDWAVDWDEWVSMSAHQPRRVRRAGIPATAPATPTDAPTLSGIPTTSAQPGG